MWNSELVRGQRQLGSGGGWGCRRAGWEVVEAGAGLRIIRISRPGIIINIILRLGIIVNVMSRPGLTLIRLIRLGLEIFRIRRPVIRTIRMMRAGITIITKHRTWSYYNNENNSND